MHGNPLPLQFDGDVQCQFSFDPHEDWNMVQRFFENSGNELREKYGLEVVILRMRREANSSLLVTVGFRDVGS